MVDKYFFRLVFKSVKPREQYVHIRVTADTLHLLYVRANLYFLAEQLYRVGAVYDTAPESTLRLIADKQHGTFFTP